MNDSILLSVDLRVNDGELEAFRQAVRPLVAFVQATEPGVLFYKFYLDEASMLARAIHIYSDLHALKVHTDVGAPWFRAVLSHATLLKIELLGDVTPDQLHDVGVVQPPEIVNELSGFVRF